MRNKLAIILGLTLASTGAMANNTGTDKNAQTFIDLDADSNGTLSQQEAAVLANIDFATADTDRDNVLSETEYVAAINANKYEDKNQDQGMKY